MAMRPLCTTRALAVLGCLSVFLLPDIALAARDSEPPTTPTGLTAVALSPNDIQLSWNASTDNRRVKRYRILLSDGTELGSTKATWYTLRGLATATTYSLSVLASDGRNDSDTAAVSVTTLDSADEPPVEKLPEEEPPVDEPPVHEPPVTGGPPDGWSLVFDDAFDGSGDLAVGTSESLWRFEGLADGLHRAGNSGMDEFGNTDVPSWRSPAGKRWSAWYDGHQTDNAYRSGGLLVMQGFASVEPDPTRPDTYMDEGRLVDYGSGKLYSAWLDTWSRKYDVSLGKHVVDPSSPNRVFRYGYFETSVSFAGMVTPGFRLSLWLMPASRDAEGQDLVVSDAYDSDGDNGVEIDIFEYEYLTDAQSNRLQLSLHGGAAGSAATTFDAGDIGVDLRSGFHTIGFRWEADRLEWSIDGTVVKTVTDTALIPDVYSYLILSREMNSGVKREGIDSVRDGDPIEVLPYRPRDPGLYASNVWLHRDRLAYDRALIDHVRVWQP